MWLIERCDNNCMMEKLSEMICSNKNIVYQDFFFDEIKSISLIEFRNRINYIQDINTTLYLERRVDEYYLQLLENYDFETNLFRGYNQIIELCRQGCFQDIEQYDGDIFIVNQNIIDEFRSVSNNFNDIDKGIKYLLYLTNLKISEIVIDGLFKDTYYNVLINIKEMLRYNNILSLEEKVLDENKIKFYRTILDIDKLSCKDKILMYKRLKDRNINLSFYDDLRMLKDLSYKKIKDRIIKLSERDDSKEVQLSNEYGVDIYDLIDESYMMLVRSSDGYVESVDSRFWSYSLISNEKNNVYSSDKKSFIYGYNSFDVDCVIHAFESDAGISKNIAGGSRKVNRIATPEQLVNNDIGYNEINIVNVKDASSEGMYVVPKPDYIVVYERVLQKDIDESKRLGIPIVIIKPSVLDSRLDNSLGYSHNIDDYTYVDPIFLEEYRRSKRSK